MVELLRVPHSREEVKVYVSDIDEIYKQLRSYYSKLKYENILNTITTREAYDNFEFLFMLHVLGTFLAPIASLTISDKLLKLMCCTIKGFSHFD